MARDYRDRKGHDSMSRASIGRNRRTSADPEIPSVEQIAKTIGGVLSGVENQDTRQTSGPASEIGRPFWKHYEKAAMAVRELLERETTK